MIRGAAACGGLSVNLPTDVNAFKTTLTPTNATASVNFNSDGTITNQDGGSLGTYTGGIVSSGIGASYKIKFDRSGGSSDLSSYPAGASDNVYTTDISSTRTFTNTQTVVGVRNSTGTWTCALLDESKSDTAAGEINAEEA